MKSNKENLPSAQNTSSTCFPVVRLPIVNASHPCCQAVVVACAAEQHLKKSLGERSKLHIKKLTVSWQPLLSLMRRSLGECSKLHIKKLTISLQPLLSLTRRRDVR